MSQEQRILKHLESGQSLTPLDALSKFGCFRLSARIYDLRGRGHKIRVEQARANGKTFARYTMGYPV